MENITRIGYVEANSADEWYQRFRKVVTDQMDMTDAELDEEMQRLDETF